MFLKPIINYQSVSLGKVLLTNAARGFPEHGLAIFRLVKVPFPSGWSEPKSPCGPTGIIFLLSSSYLKDESLV